MLVVRDVVRDAIISLRTKTNSDRTNIQCIIENSTKRISDVIADIDKRIESMSEEISILNEKVLLTKGCINIEDVYQATQSEDSKGLYMTSDDNNMWIQRANAMSDLIDSKYFVLNEIDKGICSDVDDKGPSIKIEGKYRFMLESASKVKESLKRDGLASTLRTIYHYVINWFCVKTRE